MAILDDATIGQLLEMARMGGAAPVVRIFRLYIENGPPALAEIDAALAAKDSPRLGRAAHALKSMSLSLGAAEVAALASDMEKSARSETPKFCTPLRDEIAAALGRAYQRVEALIREEGLAEAEPEAPRLSA